MKQIILTLAMLVISFTNTYADIQATFDFDIDALNVETISNSDGQFTKISYEGLATSSEIARPAIPVKYVRYSVPYNAVNFAINYSENCESSFGVDNSILMVSDLTTNGEKISTLSEPINENAMYPAKIASITEEGYIGGCNKVVTIAVYPVAVIPGINYIEFYDRVSVNLTWNISNNLSSESLQPVFSSYADDQTEIISEIKDIVDNPEVVAQYAEQAYLSRGDLSVVSNPQYQLLIIAPERLCNSLERLAAIHRNNGCSATVISIEYVLEHSDGDEISGIYDDAGKLRSFLKAYYMLYGTRHVILAGKYPEMPIRYRKEYHGTSIDHIIPTDLYFADLNSNWDSDNDGVYGEHADVIDCNCELTIGRIPFTTVEQVNNYIDKFKIYELNPGLGDPSYLSKTLLTRQYKGLMDEGDFLDSSEGLQAYFNVYNDENLLDYTENSEGPTGAQIISVLNNEPCGNYNFIGHGNPGGVGISTDSSTNSYRGIVALDDNDSFHYAEIGNGLDCLKNKNYPSWSYSISCTLMPFDAFTEKGGYTFNIDTNFGESYLLGKDYGGVAFLGNTRPSYRDEGNTMMAYFFNDIADLYTNNSGIISVSAGILMNRCRALCNVEIHEKFIHNLFGDPLARLWITAPEQLSATSVETEDGTIKYTINSGKNETLYVSTHPLDIEYETTTSNISNSGNNCVQISNNTIYTINGKNALPLILPLYISNYSFDSTKYFITGDVYCGKGYGDESNRGAVTFKEGSDITIESSGNVTISGISFESNSKLTIIADGTVNLRSIAVPDSVTLYVEANKIISYKLMTSLNANVTLIDRSKQNSKKYEVDNSYNPMVVKGKTWWYTVYLTGHDYYEEFALTIGDEVEIDGKQWYEVGINLCALYDVYTREREFSDKYYKIAYVREENQNMYTRLTPDFDSFYPISDYQNGFNYGLDSPKEMLIYHFGNKNDEFTFEDETNGYVLSINDIEDIESCGAILKKYTATKVSKLGTPTTLSNFPEQFSYVEGIGVVDNATSYNDVHFSELFYLPSDEMTLSHPGYRWAALRYVTDADKNIIYEGLGGERLWESYEDSVADISVDASGVCQWYNLQGVAVEPPTSAGIYIRHQNGKSEKVVIK